MAHINHFLNEVGQRNRRRFKEQIIATRVAGATSKGFRDYWNHLKQQERVVAQRTQKGRTWMTHEEQQKLDSQQHVKFNQLSAQEQAQLNSERDSMWAQIPQHLQEKARKLAGR